MPTEQHAELRALRMKYNAAHSAHQECVKARNEAAMSGALLSSAQQEKETAALRTLNEAREKLLAAMTELAGHSPAD